MKGIKKLIQNFITALIIVLCFGISIVKSQPALHKAFDYDGNGKTDWSVLRPKENKWYTWRNDGGGLIATPFGISTLDTPTPGDFDGDGKGDIAVWRESDGNFYYLQSSNNTFITKHLGQVGDQPVAKDYDGDGKTDCAIVRRQYSLLYWYILPSSTNVMNGYHFGIYSDHPISGDFDGDGRYDIAVQRTGGQQNSIAYYIRESGTGEMTTFIYGNMSETHLDRFIPGDFDGDGKTDITTIAPLKTANGSTYLALQIRRKSSDGSSSNTTSIGHPELGAIPVSGDYDGDGKSDFAVWQIWQFDDGDAPAFLVKQSSNGQSLVFRWGAVGDLPVASLEVR